MGTYTPANVNDGFKQLGPVMTSIDTQKQLFTATDGADWSGVMLAYQADCAQWQKLNSGWTWLAGPIGPLSADAMADDFMGKLQHYQAMAAEYSALLSARGGNPPIVPKVDPAPVAPSTSWWSSLGTLGKGVVVVVAGGAALFALDKVTELAEVASVFKKAKG